MNSLRETAVGTAIGVVIGLLIAGLFFAISKTPQGKPILLLPAPTPAPYRVHVSGAVVHPGVVSLPGESRVEDAIHAAGGTLPGANLEVLNLAAFVQNGSQISVPAQSTPELTGPVRLSSEPEVGLRIDLNRASQKELDTLPGIGEVAAKRIIEYRDKNGFFNDLEQILNVSGIGPETLEKIKPFITLNP